MPSLSLAQIALSLNNDISLDDAERLIDNGDYLVLDENEAQEKAREHILDSVWAFNYNFLCSHSKAINAMQEKTFKLIQEVCESSNESILAMIDDVDHFVEDAICCDGRGHFLAGYDGNEDEVTFDIDGGDDYTFYIYRCN